MQQEMSEADIVFELLKLNLVVNKHGTKRYYNAEGKLHREFGPAYIGPSGAQEWYFNGEKHRLNGPATIYSSTSHYFIHGKLYKEDAYWCEINKIQSIKG